jgi:hypothetical protein
LKRSRIKAIILIAALALLGYVALKHFIPNFHPILTAEERALMEKYPIDTYNDLEYFKDVQAWLDEIVVSTVEAEGESYTRVVYDDGKTFQQKNNGKVRAKADFTELELMELYDGLPDWEEVTVTSPGLPA